MDSWCFPHFDPEPIQQAEDVHRPSATVIPIFLDHNDGAAACPWAYETSIREEEHCINDAATWEQPIGETRTSRPSLEDDTRRHNFRSQYHDREEHTHTYTQDHILKDSICLIPLFLRVRSLPHQSEHLLDHVTGEDERVAPKALALQRHDLRRERERRDRKRTIHQDPRHIEIQDKAQQYKGRMGNKELALQLTKNSANNWKLAIKERSL
ncbi:hypothetical protein FMUND_4972 [Fusarium mundagurra]|uniref:Uncharacterized protein n=1 Tax=Fusarium mundagurra TaxID=1567541 RepID=A0A8H5YUS7_9HYPO|nr:hypothetical protein FMUND_4972 [Fusarium mundagurra]